MNKQEFLIKRHYLLEEAADVSMQTRAYYNAYLFANFGILVDKPEKLTQHMVKEIASLYRLNVPASYFAYPQDMRYYTKDELFIEQVLSYFLAYGADNSHVVIFDKELPTYETGEEMVLRKFRIVSVIEAEKVFYDAMDAFCNYKRPWSLDEQEEVLFLYDSGYYDNFAVACGDNAVFMLDKDISFARFLYQKDLVKLSIRKCGDRKKFEMRPEVKKLIAAALPYVKRCPMSKKQAKYFNKLVSETGVKVGKASNNQSPYKYATAALKEDNVIEAAKIYAANGSLFERNLKMLLSRANPAEAVEILNMLPANNPTVLYQLMSSIQADGNEARTFTFTKNGLVKKHVETDYETKWRKSRLNEATCKLVHDSCFAHIIEAFKQYENIGKVYVADNFYKVGLPINTSASGRGIDVIPTGSRLPITDRFIRTFVHWEHAFDIDSTLLAVDDKGKISTMSFMNYSSKPFGNAILFSGDITSPQGTEYFDLDLDTLAARGYKQVIFSFHGYCSRLDQGEIYCGYQNKSDLMTRAWDPKNIAMKLHVKGDTRAFIGFGIDLTTKELVVLNLLTNDESQIVRPQEYKTVEAYFAPAFLELNMGLVAEFRGTKVDTPEEADVVFDNDYVPTETQKVVRSYDVEKLAALVTGATI